MGIGLPGDEGRHLGVVCRICAAIVMWDGCYGIMALRIAGLRRWKSCFGIPCDLLSGVEQYLLVT